MWHEEPLVAAIALAVKNKQPVRSQGLDEGCDKKSYRVITPEGLSLRVSVVSKTVLGKLHNAVI